MLKLKVIICLYLKLFIEHELFHLQDEKNISYDIPISVLSNDKELLITSLGPIKTNESFTFFALTLQNIEKSFDLMNNNTEYKKFLIFLKKTKYIFSHNSEIDYQELLKSYDSIFISKSVFTEKSTEYPCARFIIKNNTDIIYI